MRIFRSKKSVSKLSYRELQLICQKHKIRSNMNRDTLEAIVKNINNGKSVDKEYLSAKHPDYNSNIVDNVISNTGTFLKIVLIIFTENNIYVRLIINLNGKINDQLN